MSNFVPDDGTGRERIILIGEAPGEREDAILRPFVGPSWTLVKDWLKPFGLQRSDLYITNVYPYRPPGNDLSKIPKDDIAHWTEELHNRLAALEDPWLIVPTGNTALKALTGKSQITKHRGSIYEYTDKRGRRIKTIPTIHPAATFRDPRLAKRCIRDWQRIAGDVGFRELRLPEREHYIRPSFADVEHFLHLVTAEAESLALDIETPGGVWTCVGFAYAPGFSITIPLTRAYWGELLPNVWECVRELLNTPVSKVMQNGLFDMYYIRWYGYDAVNWQWDTLAMHHTLDPVEEHSLAFMASIDTREPYWKDEAKDPEEMKKYTRNEDAFWTYNGKDVAVTMELQEVYYERLRGPSTGDEGSGDSAGAHSGICEGLQRRDGRVGNSGVSGGVQEWRGSGKGDREISAVAGDGSRERTGWPDESGQGESREWAKDYTDDKLHFYYRHYRDMFEPLLGMSLAGIPISHGRRKARLAGLLADSQESLIALAQFAGEPLHAKKGLSPIKLKRYLYGTLGLPKQTKRGTGSITTDETAIRKLMRKYPEKFKEPGQAILNFRRSSKLASFLGEGLADDDSVVRCQYRFTTDTGRLSSSKNPRGTGTNLQNQDHECRDMYIAHPGHILLARDLSQAEDRWVKLIAYTQRDTALAKRVLGSRKVDWDEVLWRARAQPWENDEHWRAAEVIFNRSRDGMTKEYHRQLGKKTRHAMNYNMHAKRFVEELLLEDVWITEATGLAMLLSLRNADPYVDVYQAAIRQEIMTARRLTNSWGRVYDFTSFRLDSAAYRIGYAFGPQSEVADIEDQWGIISVHHWIQERGMVSKLMAQVHDETLISADPSEAWGLCQYTAEQLNRPRIYRGIELTIPSEVAIGSTWANKSGWKSPPTQEEFEGRMKEVLECPKN